MRPHRRYELHMAAAGLRFVNADTHTRRQASRLPCVTDRMGRRESFAFETVFSDPAGEKLDFLWRAAGAGYNVILCFVDHDVPSDKIHSRFPRVLANLQRALVYESGKQARLHPPVPKWLNTAIAGARR